MLETDTTNEATPAQNERFTLSPARDAGICKAGLAKHTKLGEGTEAPLQTSVRCAACRQHAIGSKTLNAYGLQSTVAHPVSVPPNNSFDEHS